MYIKPIGIAITAILLLANWASQPEKNGAQFFGKLITRPGNSFDVNNIVIGDGKRTDSIPVYEKPKNSGSFTKVDPTHIELSANPREGNLAIIYLSLDKITAINVPHPDEVWTYKNKKEKTSREFSYIEIAVTEKKTATTDSAPATAYLIEQETHIYCDRIGDKTPEKMKVKLAAVDSLSIDGYLFTKGTPENCQDQTASIIMNAQTAVRSGQKPTPANPTAIEQKENERKKLDATYIDTKNIHASKSPTPKYRTKHAYMRKATMRKLNDRKNITEIKKT